jgi:hypothetical protein
MNRSKFSVSRYAVLHGMTDTAQASLMMLQGDRTYAFDANMGLSDAAAPYTATGYAQYLGSDGVVDLGGNQGISVTLPSINASSTINPQLARIDAALVLDVTAITTTTTLVYKLMVVGSNDPNFGSSNVVLGSMQLGGGANLDILNGLTTAAPGSVGGSRFELMFTNEQNNIKYEYVKLYNAGTFGSITYRAFIAVLPRE